MASMSRQTRATTLQFTVLLEFMREHEDFAFGRLAGPEGRNESDRLWEKVTSILNAENGPQKSAAKWQRTWIDWKCSTRSKAGKSRSDRRRAATMTMSEAIADTLKCPAANLSPLEEKLLAFLEQQCPNEYNYRSSLLSAFHEHDSRRDDSEYDRSGDDGSAVAEMNPYDAENHVHGDEHEFDNSDWETIEVKPHIADNDVGSTSHETSKRCRKRSTVQPDNEGEDSNCCAKRMQVLFEGQRTQSAAVSRVADALEQMVSETAKRNDLEERRLAIAERKIAVSERKALLNERKIAVEERRVAAEEHLLHCVRSYLQDKKNESEPIYHPFPNQELRPPTQPTCQHTRSPVKGMFQTAGSADCPHNYRAPPLPRLAVDIPASSVPDNFRSSPIPEVEVEITVNPDFVTGEHISEAPEVEVATSSNRKPDISESIIPNVPIRVGESKGQRVHIGSNVWISTDQWNSIQQKDDSLFCKLLATAIWTTAELRDSSVCGIVSNRIKNGEPKRQLSPLKVGVIRERLCDKLRRTIPDISEAEVVKRGKLVNRYLAEKIASINKNSRKSLDFK